MTLQAKLTIFRNQVMQINADALMSVVAKVIHLSEY